MPVAETVVSNAHPPASAFSPQRLNHLRLLEAESIHILREVASEFERPVMLYSIGKDSSVMLRLAQKAFYPATDSFSSDAHRYRLQVSRDDRRFATRWRARWAWSCWCGATSLRLRQEPIPSRSTPSAAADCSRRRRCSTALRHYNFDAAFGGARRDEEKSRAKERIYSFRDTAGQWDPKNQRPELWNLYNARIHPGESIRVFPLSNWTEMDVWQYIHEENIPVVDLYFAKERPMYVRGDALLPIEQAFVARKGEEPQMVKSRLRSLGCSPCTGAIRSDADTLPLIIAELISFRSSERANRVIDHDQEGSMEIKKREGYF